MITGRTLPAPIIGSGSDNKRKNAKSKGKAIRGTEKLLDHRTGKAPESFKKTGRGHMGKRGGQGGKMKVRSA